jgi:uncharacterized protein (DUF1499 family)
MGWWGIFISTSSFNSFTAFEASTMFKFSGQRPKNLGVQSGRLLTCPDSPNCVCSYDTDTQHGIAAIAYTKSKAEAMTLLKQVIQAMERSAIVTESADYLYAEFTSKLRGYVDDVEFYFDGSVIQVRSASRLGKSDLGVNRQRVEAIRSALQAAGV